MEYRRLVAVLVPQRKQFVRGLLLLYLCQWQALFAQTEMSINLGWALQHTLENNARLKTYPQRLRLADAQRIQAEMRPLPVLGFSADYVAGNGVYTGNDLAEYTLSLGQTLELGNKRDSRLAVASASAQQLEADYQLARVDVLAETSRRFYDVLHLQALQRLIGIRVAYEEEVLGIIEERARGGAVAKADVSKMRLRLMRSQANSRQMVGQTAEARAQLALMWGAVPTFDRVSGDLLILPPVPSPARMVEVLAQSPQLQRQQALLRLADARVRLAQANGRVNLDLSVGIVQLQSSRDQALMFDMAMPIPLSNPNRGGIAQARAAMALDTEKAELTRKQLQAGLLAEQLRLVNTTDYALLLTEQLIPQAKKLLKDTEAAYHQGRYSVLQLADAQAQLFLLERERLQTHVLAYHQILELERITGQTLVPTGQETDL